jgi:hypothetical protein
MDVTTTEVRCSFRCSSLLLSFCLIRLPSPFALFFCFSSVFSFSQVSVFWSSLASQAEELSAKVQGEGRANVDLLAQLDARLTKSYNGTLVQSTPIFGLSLPFDVAGIILKLELVFKMGFQAKVDDDCHCV